MLLSSIRDVGIDTALLKALASFTDILGVRNTLHLSCRTGCASPPLVPVSSIIRGHAHVKNECLGGLRRFDGTFEVRKGRV